MRRTLHKGQNLPLDTIYPTSTLEKKISTERIDRNIMFKLDGSDRIIHLQHKCMKPFLCCKILHNQMVTETQKSVIVIAEVYNVLRM